VPKPDLEAGCALGARSLSAGFVGLGYTRQSLRPGWTRLSTFIGSGDGSTRIVPTPRTKLGKPHPGSQPVR
jgi:hypothetical protein